MYGCVDPGLHGGRTILLVDDDDDVRQITGTLLGGLGYRILEAARASTALALLEVERDIDLLLTDIIMPDGISGAELAAIATQRHPTLRVILTSGACDPTGDVLQKPYRFEELVRRLDDVLA